MLANPEYEPEAYDVACRVCDWRASNVSPLLAAVQMHEHSRDHADVGEPYFALRVAAGFLGRDPENPEQTPEDGWNRPTTLYAEVNDDA